MVILQSYGTLFIYRFIYKILEKSCCNIETQSINGKPSTQLDYDYDYDESSSSLREFSETGLFFQKRQKYLDLFPESNLILL
jgi:hypothetical protein